LVIKTKEGEKRDFSQMGIKVLGKLPFQFRISRWNFLRREEGGFFVKRRLISL